MKNLLAIGITGTLLYLGFKAFGLNRFNVYSVVRTGEDGIRTHDLLTASQVF